jgi:hypothetical protein
MVAVIGWLAAMVLRVGGWFDVGMESGKAGDTMFVNRDDKELANTATSPRKNTSVETDIRDASAAGVRGMTPGRVKRLERYKE